MKCTSAAPAGKSQLFSTKVARKVNSRRKLQLLSAKVVHEVHLRSSGWKIATLKFESITRHKLSQLRLSTKVVREVNFRSSGWKIATFKYESVSRKEETCSEQLAERTCLENLLRGNRADNLLSNLHRELAWRTCSEEIAPTTCSEQLAQRTCLENLLRGTRGNNLLRCATARRTRIARRACRRCQCFRATHLLVGQSEVSTERIDFFFFLCCFPFCSWEVQRFLPPVGFFALPH